MGLSLCLKLISLLLEFCKLFLVIFEQLPAGSRVSIFNMLSKQFNEIFIHWCYVSIWMFRVGILKFSTLFGVSNLWHFHISLLLLWWSQCNLRYFIRFLSFYVTFGLLKGLRHWSEQFLSWECFLILFKDKSSFVGVFTECLGRHVLKILDFRMELFPLIFCQDFLYFYKLLTQGKAFGFRVSFGSEINVFSDVHWIKIKIKSSI